MTANRSPAFIVRTPYLRGTRFEGWPVDDVPPDQTTALMYRRNEQGFGQCGVGVYRDGRWTNADGRELDPNGLHWIRMVHDEA